MKLNTLFSKARNLYSEILVILFFLMAGSVIVLLLPQESYFKFEYQKGRPWMHEDLIAPFDFAIQKPQSQLDAEKKDIFDNKKYYLVYQDSMYVENPAQVAELLHNFYISNLQFLKDTTKIPAVVQKLNTIQKEGVVSEKIKQLSPATNVVIVKPTQSIVTSVSQLDDVAQATKQMLSFVEDYPIAVKSQYASLVGDLIGVNLVINNAITDNAYNESLAALSTTTGVVQEGERIISIGELVTEHRFRMLESLRKEYESEEKDVTTHLWMFIGYSVIVMVFLLCLALYLYFLDPEVLNNKNLVLLLLLIIVAMVFLTSEVASYNKLWVYALPVCLVPMIIRAFFNIRLAFFIHFITVLLLVFMVANAFEFVLMQFVAGVFVLFAMVNLKRRSQFVIAAIIAFLSYSLVFVSITLISNADFHELDPKIFFFFAISAALLMVCYPLIFLFEKAFGLVTDIRLMELAHINQNKLLRLLSEKAPGTLQHSLQLSNMGADVVSVIGGNPLLYQAGAMYHDIGKMEMPTYFVENQHTGINAHEDLTPAESAEIIISHVVKGTELGRKYHLPEAIINFIRMHHGTRKVGYFWHQQIQQFGEENTDPDQFTYHGPTPYSKETAVLMIADSIEAASRSLKVINEQTVEVLIDRIVKEQTDNNQFINADITMRDITIVKRMLKQKVLNMNHLRIAYPS